MRNHNGPLEWLERNNFSKKARASEKRMRLVLCLVLIILPFLSVACDMPNVEDSFAFVYVDIGEELDNVASGFAVSSGYVVTAKHVVEESGNIYLQNWDGEVTRATVAFERSGADIVYLRPEKNIWEDFLSTGRPDKTGWARGCAVGRNDRDSIATICGTSKISKTEMTLFGMGAKHGMSGGPCIVDDLVIGVLSWSRKPKGSGPYEISDVGSSYCHLFSGAGTFVAVDDNSDAGIKPEL